jgi:hypothetical protein
LIDAHIQRVADIARQQRTAIASRPSPDETAESKRARAASLISGPQSLVSEYVMPDHLFKSNDVVPLPERLSPNVDDEPMEGDSRVRGNKTQRTADEHAARREPRAPGTGEQNLDGNARVTDGALHPKADEHAARREPRTPGASTAHEAKPPAASEAVEASPRTASANGPGTKDHHETATSDNWTSKSAPDDESTAAGTVREPNSVKAGPLGIGELRLCRSITGFGSFETLADERMKAGQRLLVYCELTGLQYEARNAGFVSRISSRVELKQAEGGPVVWEQELGNAEDKCRRRRRDYYVNYFVDLPKTLRPGSYRLRLLQTDLVAGCSTSSDIPLEIMP